MRIALANAVGIDSGGWSIIPYASRWTTASLGHEAAFTYYPRDLAYLSSLLKRDTDHDVRLFDGCLLRLNREEYARLLIDWRPDWLVIEDSSRTFDDDSWVANQVRQECDAKILFTGQHASAFPEETLAVADTVATGEYLKSVVDFFAIGDQQERLLPFRHDALIDVADLPLPEDNDVSRFAYALRGDAICEFREIQVYTTRGCPYGCVYCVARHTYYGGPEYRKRPVESVIEELALMAARYPDLEGFFFDDEIHNADRKYTQRLCRAIIDAKLNRFRFEAMCAYAPFDRETLALMKKAGYYKVRVGIETGSDPVAESMGLKGKHRPARLLPFLQEAQEIGLKVYGTFTLGGLGATAKEDRKTVDLMRSLIAGNLLSDCQISICTPQPGAPFYDWAVAEGLVPNETSWSRFDGGEEALLSLPGYDAASIKAMRKEALDAYDEARHQRDRDNFLEAWRRSSQRLGLGRGRALVFRSSRNWHLEMVEKALALDGFDMAIMSPNSARESTQTLFPTAQTFVSNTEGFFKLESIEPSLLDDLKSFRPALVVIPANSDHCRDYLNVYRIAREVAGDGRIVFLNGRGEALDAASVVGLF